MNQCHSQFTQIDSIYQKSCLPNFLVLKFCGKAQLPQSFRQSHTKFPNQGIRWNFGIVRSVRCTRGEFRTLRSSHPQVFLGKGVLKICSKFTGEHLCRNVISIKLRSTSGRLLLESVKHLWWNFFVKIFSD